MIIRLKFGILRFLATLLCLASLSVLGQGRGGGGGSGGGGGGGGGGAGGRTGGLGGAGGSTASGTSYPANGTIGSATYYVDEASHKLVVISSAETADAISNVVFHLSQPKPQVLIKVVFVEVTYNNGYDVGLEGGVTKHIKGSVFGGASNLFGLSQQGITPTSGINTLPGAGLYTIAGDSFEATLRAIAEVGKVEVLSRPSILARNAQQATIVVGQQVPLINSVNFTTFGALELGVAYQNVGIILQVTPFINSDNTVEMIVAPQISSIDPTQSQPLTAGGTNGTVSAPYLDIRSANTVVVTPDAQTVIIGGLMQNSKTSTDSKIPVIGDIPLLGELFHHKVQSIAKSELLIFLTPYVVKDPMELARMSVDERGRYNLSPDAFTEKDLNRYLDSTPTNAPPVNPNAPGPVPAPHERE